MPKTLAEPATLSPAQVARRLGVGIHKVLAWIARGELAAVNVANRLGIRPRWRISAEALADFERRRSAVPPTPAPKPRRKAAAPAREYF